MCERSDQVNNEKYILIVSLKEAEEKRRQELFSILVVTVRHTDSKEMAENGKRCRYFDI